jgi:L-fuculose-phosphate aldolase
VPDRERLEERLVAICRRLYERGLVVAREGNVSCRIGPDRILITPAGRGKGFLRASDLVVVDAGGRKRGGRLEPSSELPMHLAFYEERPDVEAVVHGHPPTATGFAVAGVPLADCVLPEVILTLGSVPIAGYATPATEDLAASVRPLARAGGNGMLLKNHGAVAVGRDLDEAFERLEMIEQFARIVLTARLLGRVETLSPDDVSRLLGMGQRPGEPGNPWKCRSCGACRASLGGTAGGADRREDLVDKVTEIVRQRLIGG